MYTLMVLCMAAAVSAGPQYNYQAQDAGVEIQHREDGAQAAPVEILKDEREGPDASGVYSFSFETADGISRQEEGQPSGDAGAVSSQGDWTFTFPDGTHASFSFTADESGYHVESDLLPTPYPLPAFALAQVEKAKQEDAAAAAAAAASPSALGAAPADATGPLYTASGPTPVPNFAPAPPPVQTPVSAPASAPVPGTLYNVAGK
ncbi:adult-specific rigid cuticular protein 11.9-like [Penaeus chinensis]|uniref:adult-specific rigid cuticular protein 11.9-like n=1 Tax=Penaeus chinensis TaxID=139456 RepID=UPI001FB78E53|nr:adult-specific rigid cuticular protein 11.9-like [Penaeus chinensis]